MKFFGSERRNKERVEVAWQAELLWQFPDKKGFLPVRVSNVSMQGALVLSKTMMAGNRHLFVSDEKPDLRLRLVLPGDHELTPRVKIARFQKVEETPLFHLAVNFDGLTPEETGFLRDFFRTIQNL